MTPIFTDTHAHIHSEPLDRISDELIKKAGEKNIQRIITIGTDFGDSKDAVALAKKYKNVYAAVGVHPHYAKSFDYKTLDAMLELAKDDKVLAVGEIGLDFFRDQSPRDLQQDLFATLLDLAISIDKPVALHVREANTKTVEILNSVLGDKDHKVLFHCFNGGEELLEWGLPRENCFFSFAGNVTYPKAKELHSAAKRVPLEKMFIETDCPYLTPEPHRGKQNDPSFIIHTAEFISKLKDVDIESFSAQLEKNFKQFFRV